MNVGYSKSAQECEDGLRHKSGFLSVIFTLSLPCGTKKGEDKRFVKEFSRGENVKYKSSMSMTTMQMCLLYTIVLIFFFVQRLLAVCGSFPSCVCFLFTFAFVSCC